MKGENEKGDGLASRGRRDAQQVVYPLQPLFINFPSRCASPPQSNEKEMEEQRAARPRAAGVATPPPSARFNLRLQSASIRSGR